MPSQSVLLVGATGMLGARIAHHVLEAGEVNLKLLVRPATLQDTAKHDVLDPLAGTAQDLRAWVAGQRETGDEMAAGMGAYLVYMLTGEAALDDLQNDRYPDIRPSTLEEHLAAGVGA